jgi:hypothetical protein
MKYGMLQFGLFCSENKQGCGRLHRSMIAPPANGTPSSFPAGNRPLACANDPLCNGENVASLAGRILPAECAALDFPKGTGLGAVDRGENLREIALYNRPVICREGYDREPTPGEVLLVKQGFDRP